MVKYANGKIYAVVDLRSEDKNYYVYVGSTTQLLTKRWYGHAHVTTTLFEQYLKEEGHEHFRIVLVAKAPSKDKEELTMWHELWRRKLKPLFCCMRKRYTNVAAQLLLKFKEDPETLRELLAKFDLEA